MLNLKWFQCLYFFLMPIQKAFSFISCFPSKILSALAWNCLPAVMDLIFNCLSFDFYFVSSLMCRGQGERMRILWLGFCTCVAHTPRGRKEIPPCLSMGARIPPVLGCTNYFISVSPHSPQPLFRANQIFSPTGAFSQRRRTFRNANKLSAILSCPLAMPMPTPIAMSLD